MIINTNKNEFQTIYPNTFPLVNCLIHEGDDASDALVLVINSLRHSNKNTAQHYVTNWDVNMQTKVKQYKPNIIIKYDNYGSSGICYVYTTLWDGD